ncbi:MAG: class I SAM-dependent RNA methyltransferase [Bdellovibrionales bacterium]
MATLDITIDDLGAQGDGIAHVHNRTVFVAGALPDEKVRVEIKETEPGKKSVVQRATLLEILIPSSQRSQPLCPHFPQCGGCRFQHMTDSAYSAFKVEQLHTLLTQAAVPFPSMMPSVVTANLTRRRIRVACMHTNKGVIVGFNAWRSRTIIDVKSCEVITPPLLELIDRLRRHLALWLPTGESCDVQLTSLPEGVDVVLIGGPKLDMESREKLGMLAQSLNIARLSWRKWDRSPIEPIAHRTPLFVQFGETRVPFPAGSFLQATVAGEEALTRFADSAVQPGQKVLDLFCGLGTFGLSLENPKSVHFCDLDGPATQSLQSAIKANPTWEVSLRNLNTDPFLAQECNDFDFVIFDPPRGGAKAQAHQLAQSNVPTIVAISCDPTSFARDAKILIEGGYNFEKLLPVDQFLWSPHLEVAGLFVRR